MYVQVILSPFRFRQKLIQLYSNGWCGVGEHCHQPPATSFNLGTQPICATDVAAMATALTEQSWLHAGPLISLPKMDSDQRSGRVVGDSTRAFTVASKGTRKPAGLKWGKMGKWGLF